MSLTEPQEKELQAALRVTRIIALAICLGGPVIYILVYGMVVLKGQWSLFLQGFKQVPWGKPQQQFPPLIALRTGSIIACALVEAVAINGLVLGFVLGPALASLSLILMLVPPCYCLLNLPQEAAWRDSCEHHGTAPRG